MELASLQYQLPRLMGQGRVLSRTGGGIGTRGLGEQQLELDRRQIRQRISDIKRQLAKVEKTRSLHRKQRQRRGLKTISLVGYTNAGKSSLFNMLCQKAHHSGQDQAEADQRLFQTLDTTTRRIRFADGREALLSDTVGFIQDLPPHLIAAFRSTLEKRLADVILHVIDVSDRHILKGGGQPGSGSWEPAGNSPYGLTKWTCSGGNGSVPYISALTDRVSWLLVFLERYYGGLILYAHKQPLQTASEA